MFPLRPIRSQPWPQNSSIKTALRFSSLSSIKMPSHDGLEFCQSTSPLVSGGDQRGFPLWSFSCRKRMLAERLAVARKYLDDAYYLLAARRLESAVSRAYYAAYQAMWAALGEPPSAGEWRHLGIISHFVRGDWFEPA